MLWGKTMTRVPHVAHLLALAVCWGCGQDDSVETSSGITPGFDPPVSDLQENDARTDLPNAIDMGTDAQNDSGALAERTCEEIEDLFAELARGEQACTRVRGKVRRMDFSDDSLQVEYSTLRHLDGSLELIRGSLLDNLDPLSSLQSAGGLRLEQLSSLMSLNGLNSLTVVRGNVDLIVLPVSNLEPLSNLRQIDGSLTIWKLAGLSSLRGLVGLERIGGDFTVNSQDVTREEFDAFASRVEISGEAVYQNDK